MRLAVQGMNPSRTTGNAQTTAWRSAAQSIDADHSCGWLDSKAAAVRMDIRVATAHPDRHALMSCVMGDAIDQVEVSQTPLKLDAGDIIVVASDGIETLTKEQIAERVQNALNAQSAGERLLEAAIAETRRHQDNTTILLAIVQLG